MATPNQRSALAALEAARPVVARLDAERHPDDVAADVIESWSAVETALRSLLGGSALTGQALVSDVRQGGQLDYAHAHALLGFLAARDRVSRTDYRPTQDDIDAARAGFQAIEAALGVGIAADTAAYPTPPRGATSAAPPLAPSLAPSPAPPGSVAPARPATAPPPGRAYEPTTARARRGPGPLILGVIVALLIAGVGAVVFLRGRDGSALAAGRTAMEQGNRVEARRQFEQSVADDPTLAMPHVYLGRLARDDGDMPRAFNELRTAVQLEPENALALREMGQYLLFTNHPDQATRWYERAIRADPTDRVALGWMGCALRRQGNRELSDRFFQRAGVGDWSPCQAAPAPGIPLVLPQPNDPRRAAPTP